MNEWLMDMGRFVVQMSILTLLVMVVVLVIAKVRNEAGERVRLRVEELNGRLEYRRRRLALAASEPSARKRLAKAFRRDDKSRSRAGRKQENEPRGTVWVLDFHGDLKAAGVGRLAEEISAVTAAAAEGDEVVIRLESAGGLVHAYGLGAAQVDRLREAGLTTTVCVDKVAASGGYLMACAADHLRAAPFAVLGSIGVVAQLPNVHRLLKRHDIDVELLTAGEYKRTLTVFGENTEEGREKFQSDLEHIHELFKRHVAQRRPGLDIEAVATGEVWYGHDALDRGLVDALGTSEAYLVARMNEARVVSVRLEARQPIGKRLGVAVREAVEGGAERLLERLDASRWEKR
ncbi:MAG: protease SohB [Halomonas sp.]|uniref:Protease SohB n=1 Tax=Billgrantia tianxiuensis TaxID=2497861 RepID=A0A6I6SNV2_9GAMM|nr:protease SohB [Halomonas tianxiuensis]MCE8031764.1 protease SohB [Halomonas sp. MCCC 1A11057]MDX5432322.1 protease SohB [Halomonas sp.]QHC50124.1 protease SohB [Halomonas tianxiuensis]